MRYLAAIVSLVLIPLTVSIAAVPRGAPANQAEIALQALRSAVSPVGGAPGSVMASPSRANPDYFFHWVRDASIAMRVLISTGQDLTAARDFTLFSQFNQAGASPGEPKFLMNGQPFTGPWGRPQNDGPALRAIALMELTQKLMATGQFEFIREHLYSPDLPARTAIKTDLEFVAHHWQDPSFDLWEENMGDHFFTRIVQASALIQGANFARAMRDPGAAAFYREQGELAFASLSQFWDPQRGYIVVTRNRRAGLAYKDSGLDSAVILGVLQAGFTQGPFSPSDPRVIATAKRLEKTFQELYPINNVQNDSSGLPLAPAIGRYPEDRYDGMRTDSRGNPWFIATQAFAEYYYRLGQRELGDAFLRRALYHTDSRGHQSEQINRDTGYMQGAIDLTWNYASFLSATRQRQALAARR